MKRKSIAEVLEHRDNLTPEQAEQKTREMTDEMYDLMANENCTLSEIEDVLYNNGLEPDYLEDLLF